MFIEIIPKAQYLPMLLLSIYWTSTSSFVTSRLSKSQNKTHSCPPGLTCFLIGNKIPTFECCSHLWYVLSSSYSLGLSWEPDHIKNDSLPPPWHCQVMTVIFAWSIYYRAIIKTPRFLLPLDCALIEIPNLISELNKFTDSHFKCNYNGFLWM